MKRLVLVSSVAAVLLGGTAAIPADAPLPFDVSPRIAGYCAFCFPNEQVTATGRVESGTGRVRIQVNECRFPGWRDLTSVDPAADGRWSTQFDPPASTSLLRVVWQGRRSATIRLRVRARVRLAQDLRRPREFFVSATGWNFGGKRVVIDRFVDGRWRAIRSVRLGNQTVRFAETRFRLSLPPGQPLRARFNPRVRCYEPGVSDVIVTRRVD